MNFRLNKNILGAFLSMCNLGKCAKHLQNVLIQARLTKMLNSYDYSLGKQITDS